MLILQISIKDVDTKALIVLVNYAYTGVIFIDEVNVQTLLETADLLQFQSAKSLCCDFIKEQLSTENCLDIFQFADVYHCDDVLSLSQGLFNKNWKKIVDSESFSSINYETFVKLISGDFLNVQQEADVITVIAKWIQADHMKRRDKLFLLLQHVRWPYVDPAKLKDIMNQPLITDNNIILPVIDKIFTQREHFEMSLDLNMRHSYASWLYVLGGEQSFLMGMESTEIFDFNHSSWNYGFSLNRPRTSFAAVSHGDKL